MMIGSPWHQCLRFPSYRGYVVLYQSDYNIYEHLEKWLRCGCGTFHLNRLLITFIWNIMKYIFNAVLNEVLNIHVSYRNKWENKYACLAKTRIYKITFSYFSHWVEAPFLELPTVRFESENQQDCSFPEEPLWILQSNNNIPFIDTNILYSYFLWAEQ